jgi:hypothetical protein
MNTKSTVVPFPVLMKDKKENTRRWLMSLTNLKHGLMKSIPRLDFAVLLFLIVLPNVLGSIPLLPDQISQLPIFHLCHPLLTPCRMSKFLVMVTSYQELDLLEQKTCDLVVIHQRTNLTTNTHSE